MPVGDDLKGRDCQAGIKDPYAVPCVPHQPLRHKSDEVVAVQKLEQDMKTRNGGGNAAVLAKTSQHTIDRAQQTASGWVDQQMIESAQLLDRDAARLQRVLIARYAEVPIAVEQA